MAKRYEYEFVRRKPKNGMNIILEFKPKKKVGVYIKGDDLHVNLGDKKKVSLRDLRGIIYKVLPIADSLMKKNIIFDLNSYSKDLDEFMIDNLCYSIVVASQPVDDNLRKVEKNDKKYPSKVYIVYNEDNEQSIIFTRVISESVNYTRRINNLPANIATPSYISDLAKLLAKTYKLKFKVLKQKDMEKLGFGAFLAVARGSHQEPMMPILEYRHPDAKKTVVIVGKGVTFDSGGISLKPSKNMDEMKYDKSGAIAVLGILKAISELKPKINIIGVLALTENMPGGNATKPGDIVEAYNGKTIEILNTDAEGRLILADAISYAEDKYKPDYIIDMATLTGACVVALGSYASGIMSNDDSFMTKFLEYNNYGFEEVWPLPLWKEYKEMMKSKVADIKNISGSYEAGTITAAAFLSNFISKAKWVHLDIAGTAWRTKPVPPVDYGATGAGVPIVTDIILDLSME